MVTNNFPAVDVHKYLDNRSVIFIRGKIVTILEYVIHLEFEIFMKRFISTELHDFLFSSKLKTPDLKEPILAFDVCAEDAEVYFVCSANAFGLRGRQ